MKIFIKKKERHYSYTKKNDSDFELISIKLIVRECELMTYYLLLKKLTDIK